MAYILIVINTCVNTCHICSGRVVSTAVTTVTCAYNNVTVSVLYPGFLSWTTNKGLDITDLRSILINEEVRLIHQHVGTCLPCRALTLVGLVLQVCVV